MKTILKKALGWSMIFTFCAIIFTIEASKVGAAESLAVLGVATIISALLVVGLSLVID